MSDIRHTLSFCDHAGATGRDIATRDWSNHPLGPRSQWPPSLHTALSMVLSSAFPAYIMWGEDFFVFYNDAYTPILGKKAALGQGIPLRELWFEINEEVCAIARRALVGERSYFEDRLFTLERNGYPERAYFTFSYSPVQNEESTIVGVLCMIFETTAKIMAMAQHKDSEERLQLSLDASGNIGTWSYDPRTNIAVVDDRFARLFQVDAALAQDGTQLERFTNMIHPDDRERVLAAITRSIGKGDVYDVEYRIPQISGKTVWVNAKGKMFAMNHDQAPRFAGVAVDVTDRKKAEDELRRLANDLAETDNRKTQFLATLAHELRNPLAPIKTGLELIKLNSADATAPGNVHAMIERQINQMTHLIDDLMDVSRINNGKIELKKEHLTIKSILLASTEISLPHISSAGHTLLVSPIPDELMIEGDRTRLAQVFSNILTNAAKYTPAGGQIEVGVESNQLEVLISIADNGIGIPNDAIHSVFTMFSQLRRGVDQVHGGLGVGLALAKQLIEMHNGAISAHSEGEGKGTVFTVRIPVAATPLNFLNSFRGTVEQGMPQQNLRVLITDDNRDAALMLAELIQTLGYPIVKVAYDGDEALTIMKSFSPDVVFLDIGMPGKSGYEVVRELKEVADRPLRAIALTGWGSEKDKERALKAGFDHHLTKPTSAQALTAILSGR